MSKKTNNLGPKIFALLIAVILWSYVMSEVNPERPTEYRNIEVELKNTEALKRQGLAVMEPKDSKVNVRVTGKKSDMDKFKSEYIIAEADLKGYSEGQHKVKVNVSLSDASSNVRVIGIEPSEILFTFDKIITKEKAINIKTEGNVNKDYVVDEITAKPQTINLTGPRSWVNQVAEARVLVDLEDRTSSTTASLPIALLDDQENVVGDVEKDPGMVDVDIKILRKKNVPIELQTRGSLPENYSIDDIKILPETVSVKGDDSIVDLQFVRTKIVNINELVDSSSMIVELDLPEGVELLDPDQQIRLSYTVTETVEKNYSFKSGDIDIRDLDPDLEIENIESEDIKIKLKGPKNLLVDKLKDDIKIYIDGKSLKEGENQVDIKMESISSITIESIEPPKIKITIRKKED